MKKSTLLVLVVFAVLAGAFVLSREKQVSEGIHKLALTPVAAEAIVSVELGGASPVTLQASDAGWTVALSSAKEKAWPADSNQVQALVRSLAESKAPDFITEKTERQGELEVDATKGVLVKASTASGVVRELVVGKASKSGGTYIRVDQAKEVFSLPGGLSYQVHRSLNEWRDKHITLGPLGEVAKVEVMPTEGAAFTLVKDSPWKLESTAPAGFRFDTEAAQRFVTQLTSLTAQDFLETDSGAKPVSTITVTLTSGAKQVMHLSARPDNTGEVSVEGQTQRWVLPTWSFEQMKKDLEGVRDLRPLQFAVNDVEKVMLPRSKVKAAVVRDGSSWKLVEPLAAPAGFSFDGAQVDALLSRLANVRATKVAPPSAQAGPFAASITLKLKNGTQVSLEFGRDEGDGVLARGNDSFTYVMPKSQKTWLEPGLDLFKKPPTPPPGAGMQGLDQLPPEIRAQLEAQLRQQAH